jgi:KTSC domain-containing protein
MTSRPPQNNRAHNFRIVGTLRNETEELHLDWQPLESELLAAVAYDRPRGRLYLRFHRGDTYRYFTFPAEQYQEFLDSESQGRYFLAHIRNQFPYERLPRR